MRRRLGAVLSLLLVAALVTGVGPAPARAGTPVCVQTGESLTAGSPCWTDVEPYPFGYDGNPVDPTSSYCAFFSDQELNPCYLVVDSMAFRSWNRGLAAVHPWDSTYPSPYGIWRYNGTRWYPDPTFPGTTACPGNTVMWAGKLDAWLIGPGTTQQGSPGNASWPALCRFDGATDQWEPLPVPAATIASTQSSGAITSGACFAYNNCWFFGTDGAIVRWDGQTLSNATSGLGPSPWLQSTYMTAAVATTGPEGQPVAVAATALDANPFDVQPDGSAPPQLFASTGQQFAPLSYAAPASTYSPPASPSNIPSPGTDLDAIAFDANGDGWIAGNPTAPIGLLGSPAALTSAYSPFPGEPDTYGGSSPLLPITTSGASRPCPAASLGNFTYAIGTAGSRSQPYFLWSSVGVMPDGAAVAGGLAGTATKPRRGSLIVSWQPVIVQVSCDGTAPVINEFTAPDPSGSGTNVTADTNGHVSAIAAPADNDVWASTTNGSTLEDGSTVEEPPHLYQLTDGQVPDAPAGNDSEARPVVITPQPTIFSFPPPVVAATPTTIITTSTKRQGSKVKKIRLKAAVYDIGKPAVAKHGRGDDYTLSISFKVRRKIRIGLEALRKGKVVSSTGLKTFSGRTGTLTVTLNRENWPTGLKFILPKTNTKSK